MEPSWSLLRVLPMIPPSLNQELDLLGWRLADATLTLASYQAALADILRRRINCSTVVIWRMTSEQGKRNLDCIGRYPASVADMPRGELVSESPLGKYFSVLTSRGVYACGDTLNDPHLEAPGVWWRRADAPRAFLDALVVINGQPLGVLSCRQDAVQRQWVVDEETLLRRLSAKVALHLTRTRR